MNDERLSSSHSFIYFALCYFYRYLLLEVDRASGSVNVKVIRLRSGIGFPSVRNAGVLTGVHVRSGDPHHRPVHFQVTRDRLFVRRLVKLHPNSHVTFNDISYVMLRSSLKKLPWERCR